MLVIPSFEPEWAVYLIKDKAGSTQVISRKMEKNLWYEKNQKLEKNSKNHTIDLGKEAQAEALSKLKKNVERAMVPISAATSSLLEQIWEKMVDRVRYPQFDQDEIGLDGTTYYVSHWTKFIGFRSGTTWSPDPGGHAGALVAIAEGLQSFALAKSNEQPNFEAVLNSKAKKLLAELK
jgi:hypothetical protein